MAIANVGVWRLRDAICHWKTGLNTQTCTFYHYEYSKAEYFSRSEGIYGHVPTHDTNAARRIKSSIALDHQPISERGAYFEQSWRQAAGVVYFPDD